MVSIVGKSGEGLVEILDGNKYVNEFLIAKKLDLTINQTRNVLYKISDYGLVSSIRKKDKKKGWYTYFWKIEVLKSLEFLRRIMVKNLDHIGHQLKSRKEKQFYVCERCNIELTEEHALLNDFICTECGEVYSLKDNSAVVKDLERGQGKIDKQIKLIDEEIEKEKGKLDKARTKKAKSEKVKADKIKSEKRLANLKLKKKTEKEKTKSTSKKKPVKKIVKKKSPAKKKISKRKK